MSKIREHFAVLSAHLFPKTLGYSVLQIEFYLFFRVSTIPMTVPIKAKGATLKKAQANAWIIVPMTVVSGSL